MVSRADVAESRAGVAESRADAAEARAGTAEARADAAEKRADISATEKKALEGKLMQTVDANLKVRSKVCIYIFTVAVWSLERPLWEM